MEIATVFIEAFDLVSESLVHEALSVTRFSSELNRVKETISSVKDVDDKINNFDYILSGGRSERETELFTLQLVKGEKLIRKCSKVKRWNVFKRWYYSKKLIKFEAQLSNFFRVDVELYQLLEAKKLFVMMHAMEEEITEMMHAMEEKITVMMHTMEEKINGITKLLENLQNVNGFEQTWQREEEMPRTYT